MRTNIKLQFESREVERSDILVDASGHMVERCSAHCLCDGDGDCQPRTAWNLKHADLEFFEALSEALRYEDFVPEGSLCFIIPHGKVTLRDQADIWSQYEEAELALRYLCLSKHYAYI
jgi:hypothetical protein